MIIGKSSAKLCFIDDQKQRCIIQKSNSLHETKIWIEIEKDINGKPVNSRMYLSQEQIKEILPYLQKFADTGDFLLPEYHNFF